MQVATPDAHNPITGDPATTYELWTLRSLYSDRTMILTMVPKGIKGSINATTSTLHAILRKTSKIFGCPAAIGGTSDAAQTNKRAIYHQNICGMQNVSDGKDKLPDRWSGVEDAILSGCAPEDFSVHDARVTHHIHAPAEKEGELQPIYMGKANARIEMPVGPLCPDSVLKMKDAFVTDILVLYDQPKSVGTTNAMDRKHRLALFIRDSIGRPFTDKNLETEAENATSTITSIASRRAKVKQLWEKSVQSHPLDTAKTFCHVQCAPHGSKANHSQITNSTEDKYLVFDDTRICNQLWLDAVAVKEKMMAAGLNDPCPPLKLLDHLKNAFAKMDVRRVTRSFKCVGFLKALARGGKYGGTKFDLGPPNQGFCALASYYEQLGSTFGFLFTRKVVTSRQDLSYKNAQVSANYILKQWVLQNPTICQPSVNSSVHTFAREPIESICSNMECFHVFLGRTEEMNAHVTFPFQKEGTRLGLKPGRINISHIEHEFGGARHASGHAVMTNVALERYMIGRQVSQHLSKHCTAGPQRDDYASFQ